VSNEEQNGNLAKPMLSTVQYKFFYKDKFGRMNNKFVEVKIKDNELAIAMFEKENPDITWRSFTAL
jgi:hypothetical protein